MLTAFKALLPAEPVPVVGARRVYFFDDPPRTAEEKALYAKQYRDAMKKAGLPLRRNRRKREKKVDNQHRKIKGYRDLNEREIELMNKVKEFGVQAEALHREISDYVNGQICGADATSEEAARLREAEPGRWAALGKTHIQEGLMALTRAVAQPGFF